MFYFFFYIILIVFKNIYKYFKNKERIRNKIDIENTNFIIIEIKMGWIIINEILLLIEEQEKNKD